MPANITIPPALVGLFVIVAILWLANEWVTARRRSGPRRFARLQGPPPFRVRDDFLSPAELSAYHLLAVTVAGAYVILTKVSLGDLFFVPRGSPRARISWRNRIDRKHVDFLLCDPATLRPLLGVELDDQSHQRVDRKMRDDLVDSVFAVAGLPLLRVPVRATYHIGSCARPLWRHWALMNVRTQRPWARAMRTQAVQVWLACHWPSRGWQPSEDGPWLIYW